MEPDLLKDAAFALGTLGLLFLIPPMRRFFLGFYRATSDTKGHLAAVMGAGGTLGLLLILYWPVVRFLRTWLLP